MRSAVHAFGSPAYADAQLPSPELNTTSLIDIMLVLLIMFIVTIPVSTHKVPLDLPQDVGRPLKEPVVHQLDVNASGALTWDGTALSDADLPARLAMVKADPAAELHMRTDGAAPYERFDEVLATVQKAGVTRLGMIDNARFVEALR